jgi:cell wall-associated NlpC family hydrolase
MTKAEKLVETASSYIDTPFLVHGREPGKYLDCAGVVICALEAIGEPFHDVAYRLDPFTDNTDKLVASLNASFTQVETAIFAPGDVLALHFPKIPNHLAICVDNNFVIQATKPKGVRKVSLDYSLRNRIISVWRLHDASAVVT